MSRVSETRRTKRRYANELYPHADEYEVRPLAVEVPYLYARAIGHSVHGTDWFDLLSDGERGHLMLANERTMAKIEANHAALFADAVHQGLVGDEAWRWATERYSDDSSWVWDRAIHYGVPVNDIKPYPVLNEPDHHYHYGDPDAHGWRTVTRVEGKESECDECTEPDEAAS